MRPLKDIEGNLEKRGYKIVAKSLDGFMAANYSRKATIICSWAGGWEHVSINAKKTPTWEQMCKLKEACWDDTETVVQYHPARADYVNNLEHCLHLWRPIEQYAGSLPTPPPLLVGIPGLEEEK